MFTLQAWAGWKAKFVRRQLVVACIRLRILLTQWRRSQGGDRWSRAEVILDNLHTAQLVRHGFWGCRIQTLKTSNVLIFLDFRLYLEIYSSWKSKGHHLMKKWFSWPLRQKVKNILVIKTLISRQSTLHLQRGVSSIYFSKRKRAKITTKTFYLSSYNIWKNVPKKLLHFCYRNGCFQHLLTGLTVFPQEVVSSR